MKCCLLFLFLSLFYSSSAQACSCANQKRSQIEAYNNTEVLFAGKVLSVKVDGYERIALLKVINAFKPLKSKTIEVRTCYSGTCCGLHFEANQHWVIWGNRWQGNIQSGTCTRSMLYDPNDKPKVFQELLELSSFTGEKEWLNADENVVASGEMENGLPVGLWTYNYRFGNIKSKGAYLDGLKNGSWESYLNWRPEPWSEVDTAMILERKGEEFLNKMREQYLNREVDSTSYVHEIAEYVEGKKHGEVCEYNKNFKLACYTYARGILHGPFTRWNSDGRILRQGNYVEGEKSE